DYTIIDYDDEVDFAEKDKEMVLSNLESAGRRIASMRLNNVSTWRIQDEERAMHAMHALLEPASSDERFNARAEWVVQNMLEEGDPRIDDKWGPAGCIELRTRHGAGDRNVSRKPRCLRRGQANHPMNIG